MSRVARERLAVGALLALLAARAGAGLLADASVADEHPHILSGWLYWQSGRFAGGFDNPPLGQLLLALPLHVFGLPYVFASDAHLAAARVPVLMSLLALGVVLWRWGRALGGPGVGLAALAALAFEPNLVAHGHLATLDGLVTVAWWGALWAWRRVLLADTDGARAATIVFVGVVAAAVWIKLTALLLLPVALVTGLAIADARRRRRVLLAVAAAAAATAAAGWAVYGFPGFGAGVPEPLAAAFSGKWQHRDEVRFAFLAGRRSEDGFLAYYLVAIALKSPLPLLLAAVWGATRRMARVDRLLLVVPATVVVAAFSWIRVDLGVRQVLPAMPALVLLAAVGLADIARRGRAGRAVVALAAVWWLAGVARNAPQDLAYFNELAGGPAGGHRFLLDSNLDWGQDDARLRRVLEAAQERGESWQVLPDPYEPRTGRIAVDCNALHNLNRTSTRPYEWLRSLEPAGFAGWSWRLYDLDAGTYAAAAQRRPQDPVALAAYAAIRLEAGDTAGADSLLRAAARVDPAGTAVRAARPALERGDWRRAAAWLANAPRTDETARLGEWTRLEQRVAEADSASVSAAALELGVWHAERGELAQALPLLDRAARARPGDGEAQRTLAVALAHAGRWADAAAILERPDLFGRYSAERELCRDLAAADAAVTGDRGAAIDPALLLELGRAHFDAERFGSASGAFAAILSQDPGSRLALAYLGEMQVRCKLRVVRQPFTPVAIPPARTR